jgi:hypothetical protein
MSFGRKAATPGALDISGAAHLLEGSREFLRMWSRQGGQATCLIDPAALAADPAVFGIAMVDCIRHGARAWANAVGIGEEAALERIWFGFDAERRNPTDLGKEVN